MSAFSWSVRRPPTALPYAGAALGALLTAASLTVPWAAGAPTPTLLDVAVPVALIVVAVGVARWTAPAVLLGAAAATWSATALSGHLPDTVGGLVERAAIWPHAAVVAAVLALPYGTLGPIRGGLGRLVAATALLGSAGAGVPVLALRRPTSWTYSCSPPPPPSPRSSA